MTDSALVANSEKTAIRSFSVGFPEVEIADLRRRINHEIA